VWRDHDGSVSASGTTWGSDHEMRVPGVGSFFFDDDATAPVTLVPEGDPDGELIDDTFRRMVVPMALQVRGIEVLHASGVRGSDGVIALCGVSGTGKSTLAYALAARGAELWADDVVAFRPRSDAVEVLPLPFRVRLLPDAARVVAGADVAPGGKRALGEVREPSRSAVLASVFLLERAIGVDDAQPMRPATRAVPQLLAHAYTFDAVQPERIGRTATSYAHLAARVPIFRLPVPAGLSTLDAVLDRIEAVTVRSRDR
jgi:hypothetical protein